MNKKLKIVKLINMVKSYQEKLDASRGAKIRMHELMEEKECAIKSRLHQRLALAKGDSAERAEALASFRKENERLVVEKRTRECLAKEKISASYTELEHYEKLLIAEVKSAGREFYVSNGMMAEALTKETGKDWRVVHAEPYQYSRRTGAMEYVFGTYLVSDESPKYADEMVYSIEDQDYRFPLAIKVHGGRSAKEYASRAQTEYDKINWLEVYVQDLVGGMGINPYMGVFEHSGEIEWQVIRDAFEKQIVPEFERVGKAEEEEEWNS